MAETSLFRATPTWTVAEVRAFMEEHKPEEYTLLDVRQPEEYAEGHLPGSVLIPVGQLHQRLDELDRSKPAIVYCRSGVRAANVIIGGRADVAAPTVRSGGCSTITWQLVPLNPNELTPAMRRG